jgi:hypothetical protein
MKHPLTMAFVLASLWAYCQIRNHPDGEIDSTVTDQDESSVTASAPFQPQQSASNAKPDAPAANAPSWCDDERTLAPRTPKAINIARSCSWRAGSMILDIGLTEDIPAMEDMQTVRG